MQVGDQITEKWLLDNGWELQRFSKNHTIQVYKRDEVELFFDRIGGKISWIFPSIKSIINELNSISNENE